jgi:hypothetical protein
MLPGSTAALPGLPATLLAHRPGFVAPTYAARKFATLLIRGFTPLADARDYGTLVRLVRDQAGPGALVSAR